jgi:putative aldouronate transport system permease protein
LEEIICTKKSAAEKRAKAVSAFNKYKYAYLLILPAAAFTFVFCYLPLGGIILAFKNFDIASGVWGSPWVGLENFKAVFSAPNMLRAIGNTLVYGCVILFGSFPFPIILALMFNELRNMAFKKATQTISYMMYFLSWISVVGMAYSFLAAEGPLNRFLAHVAGDGFAARNYLLDSRWFLPIIFITHLWKNCGWSSVIFLAAIAGIDPTLYEAATVDGCGKWKQALHITLPGIRSTVIIVLIMSLGTVVSVNFEQVYGFQNVYTQEDTEVIGTLIYRMGIGNGQYSLSTAFGLAQGLVSLAMLLISNGVSKKLANISVL